jgi:hypothetical protein
VKASQGHKRTNEKPFFTRTWVSGKELQRLFALTLIFLYWAMVDAIASAVSQTDAFEFLEDVIPQTVTLEEAYKRRQRADDGTNGSAGTGKGDQSAASKRRKLQDKLNAQQPTEVKDTDTQEQDDNDEADEDEVEDEEEEVDDDDEEEVEEEEEHDEDEEEEEEE